MTKSNKKLLRAARAWRQLYTAEAYGRLSPEAKLVFMQKSNELFLAYLVRKFPPHVECEAIAIVTDTKPPTFWRFKVAVASETKLVILAGFDKQQSHTLVDAFEATRLAPGESIDEHVLASLRQIEQIYNSISTEGLSSFRKSCVLQLGGYLTDCIGSFVEATAE